MRWIRGSLGDPGPDFPHFGMGRRLLYIRRDLAAHAPAIFAALDNRHPPSAIGKGNRSSGFLIHPQGAPEMFVRYGRRGGMARYVLDDVYFGQVARPVRELTVTAEARMRGIAVAEPLGAMVESIAPGLYRGAFLTRPMRGFTLWEFICADDDPSARTHVVRQARRAIDVMHRMGLFHADLNLHNLFVSTASDDLPVCILDLDKARLFPEPVSASRRRANFARLARSIRKLDPSDERIESALRAILIGG
jgi:hypothetical protein